MGPQPQVVAHVPSVVRYCCQATAKMGQVDHLAWAYDFDGSTWSSHSREKGPVSPL